MRGGPPLTLELLVSCQSGYRRRSLWNGSRQFRETQNAVQNVASEELLCAASIAQ